MITNRRGVSSDADSAVLSVSHISHFSRKTQFSGCLKVTAQQPIALKQLLNCVFLFTIYAPQSPDPFGAQIKIDVSAHARIFTARRDTFGKRGFKDQTGEVRPLRQKKMSSMSSQEGWARHLSSGTQ